MNKKFFIGWLILFIAWMAGSFLVHAVLLKPDYMQMAKLFRTEADSGQYFPFMLLAHVIMAGAFVWIYARGQEAKPWVAQGVRYGVAVALLTAVPTYLIYYAVQPMPGAMVAKQILFDGVLIVVLGIIVAWWYRDMATVTARNPI